MKNKALMFLIAMLSFSAQAQYTKTINSNFPGTTIGAYAVGKGVFQMENSLKYTHKKYDGSEKQTSYNGMYSLRYGAFYDTFEFVFDGNISKITDSKGTKYSWLPQSIGAKLLLFDYVFDDTPNIRSWRANHSVQWKRWIPSISIQVAVVLDENRKAIIDTLAPKKGITPRAVLSFQSQLLDDTVFILNLKGDYLTRTYRELGYAVSFTHNINQSRWSCFIENEGIFSKQQEQFFLRAGIAYLLARNVQINCDWETLLKKSVQQQSLLVGVSYRLDRKRYETLLKEHSLHDL